MAPAGAAGLCAVPSLWPCHRGFARSQNSCALRMATLGLCVRNPRCIQVHKNPVDPAWGNPVATSSSEEGARPALLPGAAWLIPGFSSPTLFGQTTSRSHKGAKLLKALQPPDGAKELKTAPAEVLAGVCHWAGRCPQRHAGSGGTQRLAGLCAGSSPPNPSW